MHRCPRALSRAPETVRLLPFLMRYHQYGIYPDGGAMLDQPVAMLEIFDIFEHIMGQFEKKENEKWQQRSKLS